jgi:ketosteroid isomerase-like protein
MDDDVNEAVKKARLLTEAIRRNDWDAAARLLSPDCSYFHVARDVRGPQAIVDCFEQDNQWGESQFDSVERERSVEPGPNRRAVITSRYRIRHKGHSLTIRAEHVIELDEAGLIGRIEQIELASQANALFRFYMKVGIIRKSKPD